MHSSKKKDLAIGLFLIREHKLLIHKHINNFFTKSFLLICFGNNLLLIIHAKVIISLVKKLLLNCIGEEMHDTKKPSLLGFFI